MTILLKVIFGVYVAGVTYEMCAKEAEYMSLFALGIICSVIISYGDHYTTVDLSLFHVGVFVFVMYAYIYKIIRDYKEKQHQKKEQERKIQLQQEQKREQFPLYTLKKEA